MVQRHIFVGDRAGASAIGRLLAATHLFWAGLAFGVRLDPLVYLALLAILGLIVLRAQVARIPAGFIVGAVFTLGLFGVADATALAMVVTIANMPAVGIFRLWGLWLHGVGIGDLGRRYPLECS